MTAQPVTLGSALIEATQALTPVSTTARLDAEILLMHICNVTRSALITHSPDPLSAPQHEKFQQLLARRQNGEPIAYLVGTREFWSLSFKVTPAVLIPRPETELLVESALAHIPRHGTYAIADLGTGSGAVGLAIAHERPRCRISLTDISSDAIGVARDNAYRLGIRNVEFLLGSWLTPLADKPFDVIVSNPPYVRADDPHLQLGDVRFEPRTALVSGADGLDAIRHIAVESRSRLRAGGRLLLEHGYDQASAVADILVTAGFDDVTHRRDLAGHTRVTEAR